MSNWKRRVEMAVLELMLPGEPQARLQWGDGDVATIARDGYEYELTHAPTSEVALTSDACLISLAAASRHPLEFLVEVVTEMCLPGVTPMLASEPEADYLRVMAVRGALPVEAINAASLRWLFFALAVSRDALMDAE